jgi:hypothetical protein
MDCTQRPLGPDYRIRTLADVRGNVCADVEGNFPVGLLYVRRILEEVIADCWDEDDVAMLAEEPPMPAA